MTGAFPVDMLDSRVAFVTGGAGGLGKEFCQRILASGGRVAFGDFNEELGRKTAKELAERFGEEKVIFVPCNVTKEEDLEGGEIFFCSPKTPFLIC